MTGNSEGIAQIQALEADNDRLRRLLDQQDAPAELRHRLRSTMAVMRGIIRRSSRDALDLEGYVAHLEGRLDAVARAQTSVDDTGSVPLHSAITDEMLLYGISEGERLSVDGPEINFKPRAGLILTLTIHELAINAIQHGRLGTDNGRVEIAWSISTDQDRRLLLFWREPEGIPPVDASRRGFGTEVVTNMLPYELGAATDLGFDQDGFWVRISLPLTERTSFER